MPFTPFHFGIGVLAKGAAPARVSLAAFVASQVVIDCETAYFMVTQQWPLHRWAHTFAVAAPLGLIVGLAVWAGGALWERTARGPRLPAGETRPLAALLGGALGGLTHPLLDGIMHGDVAPLRPFSDHNPLLGLIGLGALHLACVVAGLVGLGLIGFRRTFGHGHGNGHGNGHGGGGHHDK
jgi:hypothetical protein